jgi:hypothetical protein
MDVLSRLGARALGVAPAIRPVIAPLFQSDPLLSAPEAEHVAPRASTPAPNRLPAEIAGSDVAEERPIKHEVIHAPAPAAQVKAMPARAGDPVVHQSRDDEPARVRPDSAGEPLSRRAVNRDEGVRVAHGHAAPKSETPIPAIASKAGSAREVIHPPAPHLADLLPKSDRPVEAHERRSHASRPAPADSDHAGARRTAASAGYLASLAAVRESVAPLAAEHEPTIVRVSIGRIEVRSSPPPIRPRPPAPAAPPCNTLADYLTRKAGDRP